jgi:aspartate aminotransferase
MRERTVTVNGFSKSFAMTGWRLGYAAAVEPIARAMTRMQSTITTGANSFVQHAAIAALEGPRDSVAHMRERYRLRRDMTQKARAHSIDLLCLSRCQRLSWQTRREPCHRWRRNPM